MKIADDVLEVLRGVECDRDAVRITAALERKLYQRVNKVLEALGGKWNRRAKAHLFESFDSNEDAVAAVIIGDAATTGTYLDLRKELQFFETPDDVVELLLDAAEIEEGMSVLEPSAGTGNIAALARHAGGSVECIEINEKLADHLLRQDFAVTCEDFLIMDPPTPGWMKEAGKEQRWFEERFDRIVMNPPFSRSQDIYHVLHAYGFLKPGGRLVSVMGIGWTFRMDRKAVNFREFMVETSGQRFYLPDKAFASAGTNVNTLYVVIDKPANADEVAEGSYNATREKINESTGN